MIEAKIRSDSGGNWRYTMPAVPREGDHIELSTGRQWVEYTVLSVVWTPNPSAGQDVFITVEPVT